MGRFHYLALTAEDRLTRGTLYADSPAECRNALQANLLLPLEIRRDWLALLRRDTFPETALAQFCQQLHTLLAAGISLPDALSEPGLLVQHHRHQFLVAELHRAVQRGLTLSQALAQRPDLFDPQLAALIESGEQSGQLAHCLHEIARHLRWQHTLAQATHQALIQPLLSAVAVIGATLFMLAYLAPTLRVALHGQAQPFATQLFFWLSEHLRTASITTLSVFLLLGIGLRWARAAHPGLRVRTDRVLLQIPLFNKWCVYKNLTAYTGTLALLYGQGIPILNAMESSEAQVRNQALRAALEATRTLVENGAQLQAAFSRTADRVPPSGWPPILTRLIALGERTGQLEPHLREAQQQLEQSHRQLTETVQSLLQPMVTVISALLLAWVAFAVFGPLYGQLGKGLGR